MTTPMPGTPSEESRHEPARPPQNASPPHRAPQGEPRGNHATPRRPVLARLGAVPHALWRARHLAAPRRALVVTASLQLALLAVFAFVSAARPYEALWLRLAAATWLLWLWPLARLGLSAVRLRAADTTRRGARLLPKPSRGLSVRDVAEELDRLNPDAPDVFRTALRPEAHAPATLDALEELYARWEPRLHVPAPPRTFGNDPGGIARRLLAFVAAALTILVLTAPLWLPVSLRPLHALNGGPGALLTRMVLPLRVLAAIPAPRLTPGDLPLYMARGDTVVVTVAVEHVPAHRPVYAHVRAGTSGPQDEIRYTLMTLPGDVRLQDDSSGRKLPDSGAYRIFRFGPVTTDFTLRFTTLNTSTRVHAVTVTPPPQLKTLSVLVTPPAYTGLPRETFEPLPEDLAVLPGSRLAWSGTADRPLAHWNAQWTDHVAEEKTEGETEEEAAGKAGGGAAGPQGVSLAGGQGERFGISRTVRAAGSLRLSLTDHAARGGGRSVAGPWRIALRADRPPEITLQTPAGDGELPRSLKVPVIFRATDDFGISAVRLHYSLRDAHGVVKATALRDVTAWRDARDGRGVGVWDGSAADALPVAPVAGETVELFLEALDNNAVQGPSRARSATVRLHLPSLEEARAALSERERAAATGLTSALEREKHREREAARPDRAAAAEAIPAATEWDVRRVLIDAPRRHAGELRRQIAAELELAREAAREAGTHKDPLRDPPGRAQSPEAAESAPVPAKTVAALEALQRQLEAQEKRLPTPAAAHAPPDEQRELLEALREDQRHLERALGATSPPPAPRTPSGPSTRAHKEQAARENRRRLEDELKANRKEQEQLYGWLQDKQRADERERARRDAATRQAEQARADLESALRQMEQAMRTGIEDGTLTPDVLEKMDRVRELLQEVLDDQEKDAWERAARDETVAPEDVRRALEDLTRKGGIRAELEQAIRMLETVRDLRELQHLARDMRTLEEEQRALADGMAEAAAREDDSRAATAETAPRTAQEAAQEAAHQAADQAADQEKLAQRLQQSLQDMAQLADKPSMQGLPRESLRKPSQEALREMQRAREQLKKERPDRQRGQESAQRAAQKLAAAAAEMEKALAQMSRTGNKAEMREVLEETLEFTRWLDGLGTTREDAQAVARVARWLAGRMDKLAEARAFESDVLRRSAASMAAHADALATEGSPAALGEVHRQARNGARELLKWLSQEESGGGSDEGDGQGDNDFGGGDQGEGQQEGTQGMASRMRGVSGQQMAANRMTQELLRSLMEERQPRGGGEGAPDPHGGESQGDQRSSGQGQREGMQGQAPGGSGRGGQRSGPEGGPGMASGSGSGGEISGEGQQDGEAPGTGNGNGNRNGNGVGRGAAANAQQQVADALESMAERADDAGGAARALRRLAEEARALERVLREGRMDPEEVRKRQERFRTRLLQSADAMEERGHRQERRAEVWAGGMEILDGGTALPMDSLATELRRRRENARRLPLTPEQKRRVEWYYERLLGE